MSVHELPKGIAVGYRLRSRATLAAQARLKHELEEYDDPLYDPLKEALTAFTQQQTKGQVVGILPRLESMDHAAWSLVGYSNVVWLYNGEDRQQRALWRITLAYDHQDCDILSLRQLDLKAPLDALVAGLELSSTDWLCLPNLLYKAAINHPTLPFALATVIEEELVEVNLRRPGFRLVFELFPLNYQSEQVTLKKAVAHWQAVNGVFHDQEKSERPEPGAVD